MSSLLEGILAKSRGWHGTIDEQFSNIDNAANLLKSHLTPWSVPNDMYTRLNGDRTQLQALINKCRSTTGSTADRSLRNMLLKSTVGFCLLDVKGFSYMQYGAGIMTSSDVHELGFLLPGETGGNHGRTEATNVLTEVKTKVINADVVRVIIDQAAEENAARVKHGWPVSVNKALIVITAADGVTEVYRAMTSRLYNDITMPKGSHGQQFLVKAAFLRHVDDEPRFGNQPTFSMPLTTEDLVAALDRQHHEDFEAQARETELHRREIERLEAELKALKEAKSEK
jgi:hypothetical protein